MNRNVNEILRIKKTGTRTSLFLIQLLLVSLYDLKGSCDNHGDEKIRLCPFSACI